MSPLLETKLYIPRPRRHPVARRRLSDRLGEGVEVKLTLVSAPAGFGKTTLLSEWIGRSSIQGSTAWLSLDQGDSQPDSFWTYLISALQKVAPAIGARALTLLREPQPPPITTILATLLNDLNAAGVIVVGIISLLSIVTLRQEAGAIPGADAASLVPSDYPSSRSTTGRSSSDRPSCPASTPSCWAPCSIDPASCLASSR